MAQHHHLRFSDFEGQSILVTGATGFVGQHLCRVLRTLNARVWGTTRVAAAAGLASDMLFLDLKDRNSIVEAVRQSQPHYVFHLAASLNRSCTQEALEETQICNVQATGHLLDALANLRMKVRAAVLASSADIYGISPHPCLEEQPKKPLNPYGKSKLQAWENSLSYHSSVPCIDARFFMLYGPGQGPKSFLGSLMASTRDSIAFDMTEGHQTRDFTHINDAVEAVLHLALTPSASGQAFNICTGRSTTLKEAVGILSGLSNRKPLVHFGALPYRENEVYELTGNPDKLRSAGYICSTGFSEGLKQTLHNWEEY